MTSLTKGLTSRWLAAVIASVVLFVAYVLFSGLLAREQILWVVGAAGLVAPILIGEATSRLLAAIRKCEASLAAGDELHATATRALTLPIYGVKLLLSRWAAGVTIAISIVYVGVGIDGGDIVLLYIGVVVTVLPVAAATVYAVIEEAVRPLLEALHSRFDAQDRGLRMPVRRLGIGKRVAMVSYMLAIAVGYLITTTAFLVLEDANASQSALAQRLIPMIGIAIAFTGAIQWALAHSINGSLRAIVDEVGAVASGDFSGRAAMTTTDELGELMSTFDQMLVAQSGLIGATVEAAREVASASSAVSNDSNGSREGVLQISEAMQDVVQGAQNQFSQVDIARSAVESLESSMERARHDVSDASNAARDAGKLADEGSESAKEAQAAMQLIEEQIGEASASVERLGEDIADIGVIVETIVSIAGQTNLLALNAAIEAARAGEIGRGFAVVADEVRHLAGESNESAQRISDLIKRIQERATGAVRAVKSGNEQVVHGAEVVRNAGDKFRLIATSLGQIGAGVERINQSTADVDQVSRQVSAAVDGILVVTESVAALAQQTSANTDEASTMAGQITQAAHALADTAQELERRVLTFKF